MRLDEAARREARGRGATDDGLVRARLAHAHLRRGDPRAALGVLGAPAEESGLEASARALAHARLGELEEALRAVETSLARELDPLVVGEALEAIAGSSAGKTPALLLPRLARIQCRLTSRTSPGPGPVDPRALAWTAVAESPDPLVRLAAVAERPPFEPFDRVSRVYGSHGPDYETGHFVAFLLPLELRLRTFEPALFGAVEAALRALERDARPDALAPLGELGLVAAFGEGYGLGGRPGDPGKLEAACERLNELDLLPWKVRAVGVRPYDLMTDEARLARRLARDLAGHPLRQRRFDPEAPLLERLLALHPLPGPAATTERLEPLLVEARARYSPVGVRAVELFARQVRGLTGLG